ncbi:hypothetical protein Tco_0086217 [Tanacetum coccineum]
MSSPKFAENHNLVAFLEKPEESDGFEEIIDFLNASSVQYALTVNPTIYTNCIEQFWTFAKVKKVNGERHIKALLDKKKVIIFETSIRSDLKLDDAKGTNCLPIATIFAELERMGAPTDPTTEETTHEEHVCTPSYDPPLSGEDRMQLFELMSICTSLQEKVLDLEKAKTAQAKEITSLKKRVKQLEKRRKSRILGLKRLRKGRKIEDLDADAEVTLVTETQERNDEEMLFDVHDDLQGDEVVAEKVFAEKEVSTADPVTTAGEGVTTANVEVTTVAASTTTIDELTLAQTLIEIKEAKPKAVTTTATTTTTTRPMARGVVVQEPSEFKITTLSSQASQLPKAKDKGKAIMVELERPLKKKDQIELDEELTLKLHAKEQAELEGMQKERVEQEEANRASILEEMDNIQAMIKAAV